MRKRGDRPGYVVRLDVDGRTVEGTAGTTWHEADKKRGAARVLVEAGTPLTDVLAAGFGDVGGSDASLRDLAPEYLAYASSRRKPSTLKGDTLELTRFHGHLPTGDGGGRQGGLFVLDR